MSSALIPFFIIAVLFSVALVLFPIGLIILLVWQGNFSQHTLISFGIVLVALVVSVLCFFLFLRPVLRIPLKTTIKNGELSTFGFHGRSSLSLSSVVSARTVLVFPNKYGPPNLALELVDSSGIKVFLQLGTLSRSVRSHFYQPIKAALSRPEVANDDKVLALWNKWFVYNKPDS
jgi:hypothetical protein